MTAHRLTPVIEAYIDAWNSVDSEKAVSFFSEKGVYVDMALCEEISIAELGDYIKAYFSVGDLTIKAVSGFAWTEDKVAFQAHTSGTNKEGYDVNVYSAEFIDFEGDKIIRQQTYYDFMLLRR